MEQRPPHVVGFALVVCCLSLLALAGCSGNTPPVLAGDAAVSAPDAAAAAGPDAAGTDAPDGSVPPNTPPTAVFQALPTSGDAPLSVSFNGSGSYDFEGPIASHAWDFGDGASGTGVSVEHVFASHGDYQVVLTVTDSDGLTGTASATIHVTQSGNQPPVAVAHADPLLGDAPLTVSFDATGSTDPDGTIAGASWDFADGSPAEAGMSVSHVFAVAGNYAVTLTVTDDGNASATDVVLVQVSDQGNALSTASIVANPVSGQPPLLVSFDGRGSTDSDGTISNWAWTFGDGASATGAQVDHTYGANGVFHARLVVTDDDGGTGEATIVIRVQSVTAGTLIIDHSSIALFDQIPDARIAAAAQLRSLFIHASVGGTIRNGMRCLAGELDNRPYCAALSDPKYSYANWTWLAHSRGGCDGKLQDLQEAVTAQPNFDVYHQKYCYFEGLDSIGCCTNHDNCVAGCGGDAGCEAQCETAFQASVNDFLDLYTTTMNELETAHPTKTFVWWTIPYAISDERCAHELNNRLRAYVAANGKILYDIADIEAHDHLGNLVTIGGHESVHPYYCGELKNNQNAVSCHPDMPYDVSWDSDNDLEPECGEGGQIRLAKAWWVMMARIAGWQP